MTENNYSYVIECGKTKFYKNGKFMTSSEVLNELEIKDMIINQFSEENNELNEFKQQVIDLINATIEELKKTNEVSLFPRESIMVLERLKKVIEND